MTAQFLYVGARRKGPSSWSSAPEGEYGITVCRFDPGSGVITPLGRVATGLSVGHLVHDARRGVLYALHETMTLPDRKRGGGGMVVAFHIDPETGALTEISRSPSFGALPCHATLDASGAHLLVVHHTGHTPITRTQHKPDGGYQIVLDYDEAATVLFPLAPEGRILPPSDVLPHQRQGALPDQTHSQLHCIQPLPGSPFFVVCDKGGDRIALLELRDGRLRHLREIAAPPASSPRTCALHPVLPVFYVNFETAPLLHAYRWTPGGEAELIAAIQVLSPGSPGRVMPSDMAISADGRRLHMLLRGPEAVASFALDRTGRPSLLRTMPMGVRNPRTLTLSPDGRRLLVAAVLSEEVKVWPIADDGLPEGPGLATSLPHAGCLQLVTARIPQKISRLTPSS